MKGLFKKTVVTALTLSLVVGGATSAFADSKGRGKGHDKVDKKPPVVSNVKNVPVYNNIHHNIIINFYDVKGGDVEWALRHIASLAGKRVFEGYPDGSFKPRNTVSRIEAITAAVRVMGLRDQAESQEEMSTELNFKDADKIKREYPWAVGYVAVAVENDLFAENETSVQPEKPADRLWATTLLVKALKLDAEARAKMNTKLPFKDAHKIPAGSVGYVAVAVEKGLIDGFEDNTFRPDVPVTRAQLAALLDRANNQMPDAEKDTVTGVVTAPVTNNVLTISKDGVTTSVYLDPNAFVFKGNERISPAAIQAGDTVKVRVYNNVGYFVEIIKPAVPSTNFTVTGKLFSIEWNQGKITKIGVTTSVYGSTTPQLSVYNVAPDYTIIGNAALLVKDQNVQLSGRDGVVTTIEIK